MNDREGLDRAYADEHGVFASGDTLFVAGTKSLHDVWDDISKIPFGLTRYSSRYDSASRVLRANPKIRQIVGHSLGGAIALETGLPSRTYGAPVLSGSRGERYRELGDPVAALDWGAHTSVPGGANPHSYKRIANRGAASREGSFDIGGVKHLYR
jgi:hypothetical protein